MGVNTDCVEDFLLLLLHLDCQIETPAGPAEHLCQQNGLHLVQLAILQQQQTCEELYRQVNIALVNTVS